MENYHNWLSEEKTSLLKAVNTRLSPKNPTSEEEKTWQNDLQRLSLAFDIAASCHEWEMRDNGKDPYITHPIAVALILSEEFPDVNMNQILIAILHDTIEKHKKFKKIISEKLPWPLATHVENLSKKELHAYLKPHERPLYHAREILRNISAKYLSIITTGDQKGKKPFVWHELLKQTLKVRRNDAYFSWLNKLDDDEFVVKLADRIHALRTIDACDSEKQARIVNATYEYFVPVSESRSLVGNELLAKELIRIAQKNTKERVMNFTAALI